MPTGSMAEGAPSAALAALAGALLDGGRVAAPPTATAAEAQTEIALPAPASVATPELAAAIEALANGGDALAFEHAANSTQLHVALRLRASRSPIPGPDDYALIMVTTGSGQRLLPLYTTAELLGAHVSDKRVKATPLTATRALELALGMGFDGVEIDRGSAQAYRLTRAQMQRLHQALYQTLA